MSPTPRRPVRKAEQLLVVCLILGGCHPGEGLMYAPWPPAPPAVVVSSSVSDTPPDAGPIQEAPVDAGPGICTDGELQPCYTGPAGTVNVGTCRPGIATCWDGLYGACSGEVLPTTACGPSACGQGGTTSEPVDILFLVENTATGSEDSISQPNMPAIQGAITGFSRQYPELNFRWSLVLMPGSATTQTLTVLPFDAGTLQALADAVADAGLVDSPAIEPYYNLDVLAEAVGAPVAAGDGGLQVDWNPLARQVVVMFTLDDSETLYGLTNQSVNSMYATAGTNLVLFADEYDVSTFGCPTPSYSYGAPQWCITYNLPSSTASILYADAGALVSVLNQTLQFPCQ